MKQLAKNLYNKINANVEAVKDNYALTSGIGLAATSIYLLAAYKQNAQGNRKAMIAMSAYAGYVIQLSATTLLEKYRRDNHKAASITQETVDELLRIDADPELFAAELKKRTVETYKGYPVVVWDDYTALQTQIPAALKITIACLYELKTILVSKAAYEQNDRDVLETIFEHEIGHMVLGHSRSNKDAMTLEYEADAYAHQQGHDIHKALRQLRREVVIANFKYGSKIDTGMLTDRIRAVRSLG
jgi:Zn-dependent protease with chaperone function